MLLSILSQNTPSTLPNFISALSPLIWYKFDESSGTTATDSGSLSRNGTAAAGVLGQSPVYSPAVYGALFDGSGDRVTFASTGTTFTTARSVGVCIDVDTAGTILEGTDVGYLIDNQNKKVLLEANAANPNSSPIISSDSDGLIANLTFEVVTAGDPTKIAGTYYPPENTMLLVSEYCYESSDPPGRMLVPKFFLDYVGDVNCDGKVDIQDLVYLQYYLLLSGPPPCNP